MPRKAYTTMSFEDITEETLEAVRKASATSGVLSATGIAGYDLSQVVSLVPVNTPTYDSTAREDGDGSTAAHWKALLNLNNQQPNPFVGLDAGGQFIEFQEQDMLAPYLPVRVSGQVTRDAVALSKNYSDAKAIASVGTLMQWRIQDNKAILGGQNWALPALGTVTSTTSTTGGSIAASTAVTVKVQARSAYNYFWGGSGVAVAANQVTTGAGSTNSVTASWAPVKGAFAYDVFAGGSYITTVTAPTVTITSVAAASSVPARQGVHWPQLSCL